MIPAILRQYIKKVRNVHLSQHALNDDKVWLNKDLQSLTSQEKEEVINVWGFMPVKKKWIWRYHAVYKTFLGYNCNYVPGCCYYPYIIRTLNPPTNYEVFENKSLLGRFISVQQPETVVRSISGVWYDQNYNVLNYKNAIDLVHHMAMEGEIIMKPSQNSCCGRGIEFISRETSRREVDNLLSPLSKDIIIQKVVEQSAEMKQLNSTSLNCLRVSTLNLNGNITVTNVAVKIGGEGMRVDNVGGDHNGVMYGVHKSGRLSEKGFKASSLVNLPETLKEFTIPNYQSIMEFAVEAHKCLPQLGLVGWDIALDKNNRPIMIEANLWWPGIMAEQIGGPFFSSRTEEVLKYLQFKKLY